MEFSNEFLKRFSKTKTNRLDKDDILTIKGINYLGQNFITSGIPMGGRYIDSDSIGLYLGQIDQGTKTNNYLTFFNTYYNSKSKRMYILSIEQNGNIIYKNEDAEEIINQTKAYGANLLSSNITISNVKEVSALVGKPALIQGKEPFAVKSIQQLTTSGKIKVEGTNGTFEVCHIINDLDQLKEDSTAIIKPNENAEEIEM